MSETSADVVNRYLQDALSSEQKVEAHLAALANGESAGAAQTLLAECAAQSRRHQEQLKGSLQSLGEDASHSKGLFAHIFETNPKPPAAAALGTTRHARDVVETLTRGYHQVALYETLAVIAEAAGESDVATISTGLRSAQQVMLDRLLVFFTSALAHPRTLP